jgi:uncharacterized protein YndB with AHSA1/START domain
VTGEFSVTVRRVIDAPAEELFDAWLDPQSLATWLKPGGPRETRAEVDPRVGGEFRIDMVYDETCVVHGTYREIDRPNRLVFTWSSPDTHHRDSLVTVTFTPSADSTIVEIHQIGLPDEESQTRHQAGWSDILRELDRHHA